MNTPERLYLAFLLVASVTACASSPGAADCRICSNFEDSSVWVQAVVKRGA